MNPRLHCMCTWFLCVSDLKVAQTRSDSRRGSIKMSKQRRRRSREKEAAIFFVVETICAPSRFFVKFNRGTREVCRVR